MYHTRWAHTEKRGLSIHIFQQLGSNRTDLPDSPVPNSRKSFNDHFRVSDLLQSLASRL